MGRRGKNRKGKGPSRWKVWLPVIQLAIAIWNHF